MQNFEVIRWTGECGYIYLISNILMLYQIHDMIEYVNNYKTESALQRIIHRKSLTSLPPWIEDLNEDLKKVHGYDNYELLPVFTLTHHSPGDELDWHFDSRHTPNEKYKMVMYLTESGGTQFRINNRTLKVKPHRGDIVLFDLCYEHRGSPIKAGEKLLFGMRIGLIDNQNKEYKEDE